MIFALDIGNTNIVLGIIDTKTEEIVFTSRISSEMCIRDSLQRLFHTSNRFIFAFDSIY